MTTTNWLSAHRLAEKLDVSLATLAKWRQRGIGPKYSCALGRDPRYRDNDVADWMEKALVANTVQARHRRRDGDN